MTLTAMTIDRYYAIVHPIRSLEHRTPKMAVLVSVIIWLGIKLEIYGEIPFGSSNLIIYQRIFIYIMILLKLQLILKS